MRVDNIISDLTATVRQILYAIDGRLSANENLASEGTAGQVLTSNGVNSPPSYKAIDNEVLRVLRDQGLIP